MFKDIVDVVINLTWAQLPKNNFTQAAKYQNRGGVYIKSIVVLFSTLFYLYLSLSWLEYCHLRLHI